MEQIKKELLDLAVFMAESAIRDVHKFLFLRQSLLKSDPSDVLDKELFYIIEDPTPETYVNKVFMGCGSLAAQGSRLLGLQAGSVGGTRVAGDLYECRITLTNN